MKNILSKMGETAGRRKAKSISEVCVHANLQIHSEIIKNVTAPSILLLAAVRGSSIGLPLAFLIVMLLL